MSFILLMMPAVFCRAKSAMAQRPVMMLLQVLLWVQVLVLHLVSRDLLQMATIGATLLWAAFAKIFSPRDGLFQNTMSMPH